MRLTYATAGRVRGAGANLPASVVSDGKSLPVPTGGWDTQSPINGMPPENAVELVNWFPQPGWVELRKGHIIHSQIAVDEPIDSLMAYQGEIANNDRLFAAAGDTLYDVTASTGSAVTTGFSNPRFQHTQFAGSGGHFLWICNGEDVPRFYNGSGWTVASITGVTASDMIQCVTYRGRIWTVLRDSTTAAYLPLDSVQGAAQTFELGGYFSLGGELRAIGCWSADTSGGTNEFIVFVSSFGECSVFLIYDPTSGSGLDYRGTVRLGSPIGRRCLVRAGGDLAVITLDGVIPFSQVGSYDQAVLVGQALTKKIQSAMTSAAANYGDQFGWQMISYPRGNMAILNVPVVEGAQQNQFVMNTLTGAWARFEGQNANCWEIFQNRAYFGGNDGLVRLADESSGDENSTLTADMQCAYNYYGARGRNKRWTTLRPLITKDTTFAVNLQVGLSIDFVLNDQLDDVINDQPNNLAIWNDPNTKWNEAMWPGIVTSQRWLAVSGIGYAASIRMKLDIPWVGPPYNHWILAHGIWDDTGIWIDTAVWIDTPDGFVPGTGPTNSLFIAQVLKVNSFDVLFDMGAFI